MEDRYARVGAVHLHIRDLQRSVGYLEHVLGVEVIERVGGCALVGIELWWLIPREARRLTSSVNMARALPLAL